jgi:hypothetical protein
MAFGDWVSVADPPKTPGRYLIAYDGDTEPIVYTAEFGFEAEDSENPGEPWWGDDATGEDFTGYVLAWMPLPVYNKVEG